MNKFQELFEKSNYKPITYNKKNLYLIDYLTLNNHDKLRVKILSAKRNRTQIFSLIIEEPKNKKYLEVNGKKVRGIPFHKDLIPKEGVEITIINDNVKIKVSNRGSLLFFWPMVVEKKGNKRIYFSNADDQKERFDDLVFEIEIIKAKE